jgi:hypothetical protein
MSFRAHQAISWIFTILAFALFFISLRADDDTEAREALWLADHAKLEHKVKTLVIGDVDLKDVTVDQALDFLRSQSKFAAPDHQAINFFIPHEYQSQLKGIKFTVNLKNATVEDVLLKFPLMLRPYVGDLVVTLEPNNGDSMCSRTFTVPDNRLAINDSMLIDQDKQTYNVRSLFQAKGIQFPPGTSAVYTLPTKSLTVVLVYPEEIIHVDELLVYGFKDIKSP